MRWLCLLMLMHVLWVSEARSQSFPGGFLEPQGSTPRPKWTTTFLNTFLPATRGVFTFPAPYNTRGVRITQASDCGGLDCVHYVGYAYWPNMNNHVASNEILIVLGMSIARGGEGPTLFRYDKTTEAIVKDGPLWSAASPDSIWRSQSTEMWHWSFTLPTKLYMVDNVATQQKLLRFDVVSKTFETIFTLVGNFPGCTASSCPFKIRQTHANADDTVFSMTVTTTGSNPTTDWLGCLVYQPTRSPTTRWYPKVGAEFDECHLDKSGQYVIALENNGGFTEPTLNRFFDNHTGAETRITGPTATLGHLDSGYGYFVGADNTNALPNASIYYAMNPFALGPVVHKNPNFNVVALNYVAHSNAMSGQPLNKQVVCGSHADATVNQNEVTCLRIEPAVEQLIVAPIMTDLTATGGQAGCADFNYCKAPKGNLDVTGRYFLWTSNLGSTRLDAILVKVPELLTALPPGTPTEPAAPNNLRVQ